MLTAVESKDEADSSSEFEIITESEPNSNPMEEIVSSDEKGQSSRQLASDEIAKIESKKDKKSPESYSTIEEYHDETYTVEKSFISTETVYLKMQGCRFEENAYYMIYKDAFIDFHSCMFEKSVYIDCFGKVDLNIQDCIFKDETYICMRKNSSLVFNGNICDDLSFVAFKKNKSMIKKCEFSGETTLDFRDDAVLKCEVNQFCESVDIKIFDKAKATFQKNSFSNGSKISFHGDSIFTFEANECEGRFELCSNGKNDSTIERNIFDDNKIYFSSDAIFRFKSNICHKNASIKIQGDADVNIQKCTFDGSCTLAIHDREPIEFRKNLCAGETLFNDNEHVKLVVEKNSYNKVKLNKISSIWERYLVFGLFVLIFFGDCFMSTPAGHCFAMVFLVIISIFISWLEVDREQRP